MAEIIYKNKVVWLFVALLIFISIISYSNYSQNKKSKVSELKLEDEELDSKLNEFVENIVSGGPPKDGIPPIDNPKYIPVLDANDFLDDNDVVFVAESKENIKIFPQKLLVWHEILNDVIDGEKVSITYCPLTASVIGYKAKIDGVETTLGTSGKLLNSNLVMYDRETESYWPQITGTAVNGNQKGNSLEEFPVVWTRWNKAKEKYPNALVLSKDTGFLRSYGTDPYGSYLKEDTYYDSGGAFFPVMVSDDRLAEKEIVVGIRTKDSSLAIVKSKLAEDKVANLVIDDRPIVALYDESLDTVRVYAREVEGRVLNFEIRDENLFDRESNSQWSVLGESFSGEGQGTQLELVNSFNVMWFAWVAFYPQTQLYE